MSSMLPGMGGDFAKGVSGTGGVYDTSPAGLGLSPAYLGQGASASASGFSGTLPSGSIIAYGGATAPAGYVFCDGSTYDGTQSTYSNLWTALGVTYGGSGQSAFKVPDIQGRVAVGKGTNADVSTLGNSDGVTLANRRPKHRHTAHGHSITDSGHSHSVGSANGLPPNLQGAGSAGSVGGSTASATTGITIVTADGGSGIASDSLDAPAYLVVNYIIAL